MKHRFRWNVNSPITPKERRLARMQSAVEQDYEAAKNPKTPPSSLEILAKNNSPRVLKAVTKNPNTPKAILFRLAEKFPKEFLQNPIFELLQLENSNLFYEIPKSTLVRLLEQSEVPSSWLALAQKHPTIQIRLSLAKNPRAPRAFLEKLLESNSPLARKIAAQNPQISSEMLDLLRRAGASEDLSSFSQPEPCLTPTSLAYLAKRGSFPRLLAAKHPNTSLQTLEKLARDESSLIRQTIATRDNISESLLELLAKDSLDPVRKAVAENDGTPPKILVEIAEEILATSTSDPKMYWVIAKNPNTPTKLLIRLFQKIKNEGFSFELNSPRFFLEKGLCQNPKTPKHLFPLLSQSYYFAARDSDTSLSLLVYLLGNPLPQIRSLVAQNPSTPPKVLRVLYQLGANKNLSWYQRPDFLLSQDVLEEIATQTSFESNFIQSLVARHANTPVETLNTLTCLGDFDWVIGYNANTPSTRFNTLLQHGNTEVRRVAAIHKNCPKKTKRKLLHSYKVPTINTPRFQQILFQDVRKNAQETTFIAHTLVQMGDWVQKDDPLFTVDSDNIPSTILSPFPGKIAKILVQENESISKKQEVMVVDTKPNWCEPSPPPILIHRLQLYLVFWKQHQTRHSYHWFYFHYKAHLSTDQYFCFFSVHPNTKNHAFLTDGYEVLHGESGFRTILVREGVWRDPGKMHAPQLAKLFLAMIKPQDGVLLQKLSHSLLGCLPERVRREVEAPKYKRISTDLVISFCFIQIDSSTDLPLSESVSGVQFWTIQIGANGVFDASCKKIKFSFS